MAGKLMVGKYLVSSSLAIMAVLAAGVALYSLRYYGALVDSWLDVDPNIRAVIEHVPIQALTYADRARGPCSRPVPVFSRTSREISGSASLVGPRLCRSLRGCRYWRAGHFALSVRRPGRGTWLRHSGGAVDRYHAWRLARRCAAPIRAASPVDALQLRDDLRRGDLAAANSDRVRAGICELFGDVGMAPLHLLDSERGPGRALFLYGCLAPSAGACDGLISAAGNTDYEGFDVRSFEPDSTRRRSARPGDRRGG